MGLTVSFMMCFISLVRTSPKTMNQKLVGMVSWITLVTRQGMS